MLLLFTIALPADARHLFVYEIEGVVNEVINPNGLPFSPPRQFARASIRFSMNYALWGGWTAPPNGQEYPSPELLTFEADGIELVNRPGSMITHAEGLFGFDVAPGPASVAGGSPCPTTDWLTSEFTFNSTLGGSGWPLPKNRDMPNSVVTYHLQMCDEQVTVVMSPVAVDDWQYYLGDANLDKREDQLDLIAILAAGKYGTQEPALWAEGDFTGDGIADHNDIVAMLQTGRYEHRFPAQSVPEPTPLVLAMWAAAVLAAWRRTLRPIVPHSS
jgi:hypothetical protein